MHARLVDAAKNETSSRKVMREPARRIHVQRYLPRATRPSDFDELHSLGNA